MSLRTLVANHLVGIHGRTEYHPQYSAHLLVEYGHRHLSFFQQLFERLGQMIVVISKLALLQLAIRKRSHLYVETASNSLPRVSSSTPVADQGTIPLPLFLQDAVQQFVMLTTMDTMP